MAETDMQVEAKGVPTGHQGGPPLYGRMMKAIQTGHTFGNRVRMLKLPLIFLEERLYAGAIAQFYFLSAALEAQLDRHSKHPLAAKVLGLGLRVTPGYEADLRELYGQNWQELALRARSAATSAYVGIIEKADVVSLVAAAFILYGALVVGGGKATQAKVRKVIPRCEHSLFDVAEDMQNARQHFKNTFTAIGKEWPEHFATLEAEAARFMELNNCVVMSVRCWGMTATAITAGVAALGVSAVVAIRARAWA
mmetsp:Transcript_5416/g.10647  ORF Transcript_5416/g.10647 Transcript_5416/m.10647 type:complete len:252 (-) Transcript_5416:108-863(-)|eukprot:CAMPEP_0119092208 /NCGR_PEP_ID=MMETSP1178-20130426/159048_1 /TAXON_ID=33656 /ORGANISM="unid sp, Strain CCMP2000" /LENGTH=251 /DNA_ID=CAMNT_0007075769 /DNA_START=88 /DNA_END=843 /DNA_ORIENTATION=+